MIELPTGPEAAERAARKYRVGEKRMSCFPHWLSEGRSAFLLGMGAGGWSIGLAVRGGHTRAVDGLFGAERPA